MPFGGVTETVMIGVLFSLFLFALVQGILAIRQGRVADHRRWMLRMMTIALVPVTMRPMFSLLVVFGVSGPTGFLSAMMLSILVNILVSEYSLTQKPVPGKKLTQHAVFVNQ